MRIICVLPIKIKANAGSSVKWVSLLRLLKAFFSVHAHTPTAIIDKPSIYNIVKNISYTNKWTLKHFTYYPKQHIKAENDVF